MVAGVVTVEFEIPVLVTVGVHAHRPVVVPAADDGTFDAFSRQRVHNLSLDSDILVSQHIIVIDGLLIFFGDVVLFQCGDDVGDGL